MNLVPALRMLTAAALLPWATTGHAGTLSGTVVDPAGQPRAHVFVTARNRAEQKAVTVLSASSGTFRIEGLAPGTYDLRARSSGFSDGVRSDVEFDGHDATASLALKPDDGQHLSTPGSAWLGALANEPAKAKFIISCTICHDPASVPTHIPRDRDGWQAAIHLMRMQQDAYSMLVGADEATLAGWLAGQHYGERIAPFDPFAPAANVATGARVTEYFVGSAESLVHDAVIDPSTGCVYAGDYLNDKLIMVNPRTGIRTVYPAPVKGAGMHTLSFDRDGYLWITLQLADKVARFDTRKEEWRLYEGLSAGTQVHSFALDPDGIVKKDAKGRLIVSLFSGNRFALLDPSAGRFKEIPLPGEASDKPYGIAVDSKGTVWYTKYSNNKMGLVDPETGKGEEWPMQRPDSGPHRMTIDGDDNLWFPVTGYGTLARYNTRTRTLTEFALPDSDTFPYQARYDRGSDRVWVTGDGGNAIYALDPGTGRFTTFRLPSYLSYGRNISIDPATGDVWTALASYPNKFAMRDSGVLVQIHRAVDLARGAGN